MSKEPHVHNHTHEVGGVKNIKTAFVLNFCFTLLEIAGGIWTNSMAILSDALHDLGDSLSLGIAWYFEKKSQKSPDDDFTYGYARFSLLGALINGIILITGSVLVLSKSIPRIFSPEEVQAKGMLIFAVFGIVVNLVAMFKLRKGDSLNEKMVSWHLLEDVLGWAAVLVASIILMFFDFYIIDPILSVGITLYVIYNATKNLKQVIDIFLQRAPSEFSAKEIEQKIKEKFSLQKVYHTHIWSLDGEKHMLSMHIVLNENANIESTKSIRRNIREYLNEIGIEHATIEVEFEKTEEE